MKVKVILEVSLEDLVDYQQSYLELKEEPPDIEEIKNIYIEHFLADKNDYLCKNEITVYFI